MKKHKVFLDSCDPSETQQAVRLLGHIDGQTTNPTLLVRSPDVAAYVAQGKKLTHAELMHLYAQAVREIARHTHGAISVEVYADWRTTSDTMLEQAQQMQSWGENIYIKFPTVPEGLKAAHAYVLSGGKVNMTLVFDQSQAAAVYSATSATTGTAFVSPFVGRWDDRGYDGLDLIKNIRTMYDTFDHAKDVQTCHVEILAASLRTLRHIREALTYGADIVTAPLATLEQWVAADRAGGTSDETAPHLTPLPYHQIPFSNDYMGYSIDQSPDGLLAQGLEKFAHDWSAVIQS